jgi:uncharacterized protein
MANEFPCNSCGLCCQHISGIKELEHFDNGQGVCIHLKNHQCSIYENRPDVCRVDVMYERYYKQLFSWDDFVKENVNVCKGLQEKAGIPASLQIEVPK